MPASQPLRPRRIFLYQYLSFGIYFYIWCNRLGNELSAALKRRAVPTMWWFILPGGAYYWMWRMTESLDTATAGRIKQVDTFLLYILFSCAGVGSGFYGPHYSYHTDSDTPLNIHWRTVLIIVAIVLFVLLFVAITLHAVFMSIVQNKLNKVRGK